MSDAEKAALGNRAKEVLENPAFKLACKMIEETYFAAWKASNPEDSAGRERLYIGVAVQSTLIANLNSILGDGKIAQHNVQRAMGKKGV